MTRRTRPPLRLRLRLRDDRGFVAVWTVAIMVAIFAVIGFTLDAGRVVRARSDAFGTAAAAARAGTQMLDERAAVEGRTVLDAEAATQVALDYAQRRGYEAEVTVDADALEVTVTVSGTLDPHMFGLSTLSIVTTATAQAIQVSP